MTRSRRSQSLDHSTWPELADEIRHGRRLLVVVPLGSCEQHGPHLPFNVDTLVAQAVARGLAAADPSTVLGPPLEYGASGEHERFPGTVSVGHEALTMMLVNIGRSASLWAERIVFINGHGGNTQALVVATTQLRSEGRDAAWWPCPTLDGDAHAGRMETSLMLTLHATSVRVESASPGRREPIETLMPVLREQGVIGVSPNGVLGDPDGASAAEGAALIAELKGRLLTDVGQWAVSADGRLSPTRLTAGSAKAEANLPLATSS